MARTRTRRSANGKAASSGSNTKLDSTFFEQIAENTGVHVIVADSDLRIVYMNPASVRTLRKLEHLLPCRVDDMIGSSIDIFHKQPEMQRRLLADPRNLPHRANIRLGDEILDLTATAIRDSSGNYIGPMINWELITEAENARQEQQRLQQMVENSIVRLIMADRDLNIVYMNPASIEQLRKLQHLLPCRVDEMIGRSIDIFHKNPAHQRRLLADPRNLPHRAKIKLGDEILDLTAVAIMDNQGNYVGPMINWDVITEAERVLYEQQRLTQMVENASVRLIIAARDFRIVYMNPASIQALRRLQHLLPCRVEDMVGKSIDIFH